MRRAGGFALILLLLGVAFGLGLFLTRSGGLAGNSTHPVARPAPADPVAEVREELVENYYRELGPKVLSRKTIPELLEALGDPNTEYLTAAAYTSLKNRTARSYSGVGLTVEPSRAGLVVTSALRGPARQAGVRPGDIIVRIEGRPAGRLTFDQSINLIKGEKGTVVHLTVRRENGRRLSFTVVRSDVAVPSLSSRLVRFAGTKIGYVRLQSFPDSSAQRVNDATEALVGKGAKGIILDLRDNPGGLLTEAVRTASVFLDRGVVCTVAGPAPGRVGVRGERRCGVPAAAGDRARKRGERERRRDRRRGACRQRARGHRRAAHLRQGLGAVDQAPVRRQRPQADDGDVPRRRRERTSPARAFGLR